MLYQVTQYYGEQKIEQKLKMRHLTKRAGNENILFLRKQTLSIQSAVLTINFFPAKFVADGKDEESCVTKNK